MRAIVLLSMALACVAQMRVPDDVPPPNEPPHLWRASATEQDGEVSIRIARPEYETPRKAVAAEPMKWHNLKPVRLGKSALAFGVDGKRMDSKAVARALRQPAGVVVFVRFFEPLVEPAPFYLDMIREGTVVLVVSGEAISDSIP